MIIISKILFLLTLITIYSSNCKSHELVCIKKTKISFGPLGIKPACQIDPELDLVIHDENANVTIKNSATNLEVFSIKDGEIWYFPNIIQFEFPNLAGLEIVGSKLRKISKENFLNASKLVYLDLSCNEIQELEANLFKNNLELTNILLKDNKIKKIHPTAFDGPKQIGSLGLQNNICFEGKFENMELATVIEKIRITCWNQYEFMEKIEDVKKNNSILISNLTSQFNDLRQKLTDIDNIKKNLARIIDELSKKNITFGTSEAPTTTTTTSESVILEALNIKLDSLIPIPLKPMDISIANCGIMTFIFALLMCCICCRKSPKPIENLKTIIVKSSDYERMKEMTTIRKSVHQDTADDDAEHHYDVPLKVKSEDGLIKEAESEGSFDDVLDEEPSGVQTDWLVAYKVESHDRE